MKKIPMIVALGLVGVLSLLGNTAQAMERYIAGVHYKIVAPEPSKTATPHVLNFFSYACPHCYHLEPQVAKWKQTLKPSVSFDRVPAQWNAFFTDMAKFYYTLDLMKVEEQHSDTIFDVIHKKKRSLHTPGGIVAFVPSLGVDKGKFETIFKSADVEKKMREGKGLLAKYKVPGVPSFVINGRYFVNVSMAGSVEELFSVMDFLLDK
ncbi:hypothetical protein A9Q99_12630 [Gammaproteobacteria bacterium 45_16_T64]|mgnify:CR=1 FL=1|nr:hypothetical protein A9Q99_12630 [Gammaproteobacteria bacterium 45_16_T64]